MARAIRNISSRLGRALQQAGAVGRDVQASTSAPTFAQRDQLDRGAGLVPNLLQQADEFVATKLTAFAANLDRHAPAAVPRLRLTGETTPQ